MNQILPMHRSQTGSNLGGDFQRQLYRQPPGALNKLLERLSLHELHRVEVTSSASPQIEDRGDIWMAETCRHTGFAQKTSSSRLVTKKSLVDDFQCDRALQVNVDRFVSDPHRSATQLDEFTVFGLQNFIMFEALLKSPRL